MVDEWGPELSVIGKAGNLDKEGLLTVTGKLDYTADHFMAGKLYAGVLHCPYAHAEVKSIDTSQAEALEGVKAVITHEDFPETCVGRSRFGWEADGTKYWWGAPVAAVAAVDENTAERALELIDVEYDILPAVIDPDEAMKPGAPLQGWWEEGNIRQASELIRGDIDAGFAEADVIVEETVGWTGYFSHNYLEPAAALAWWVGDKVNVWVSSQNPTGDRRKLAAALGMKENKVYVYSHGSGGGYGGKSESNPDIEMAILSRKAGGKPVQLHRTRWHQYFHRRHQQCSKATLKIGAKNDGTLTAIDYTSWADAGGNERGSTGQSTPVRRALNCPNAKMVSHRVMTNKPLTGGFRCIPCQAGVFHMGSVIDKLSEKLGMNPYELRKKIFTTPDMPDQDTDPPLPLASNGLVECLDTVATAIGYSAKWHPPGTSTLPDGRLHGIGISGNIPHCGGSSGRRGGIVTLTNDGTALITTSVSRLHSVATGYCHIVAETLGMNYEDVNVGDWGNANVATDSGGQGGSRNLNSAGTGFRIAAEDARSQLFEYAADMLEVSADELDAKEGKIFVKADPSKFKTHAEVMAAPPTNIIGRGVRPAVNVLRRPLFDWPVGTECLIYSPSGVAVEVAVDPETGEVEVLNIVNAVDCGRAIWRSGVLNQIDGGTDATIGQAFFYEQTFDPLTGATLNGSFLNHKHPTTLDIPEDKKQALIVETLDAYGSYGSKGCGEPPVTNYSAIQLAIYNATGKWIEEVPIYPSKILESLGKA